MAYPVKYFSSKMRGAPSLDGTPGSLINVIDAVGINGFGQVTAVSLVVTAGKAKITFDTDINFETNSVVLVSGVNVTSLNGEQYVVSKTTNSITYNTLEPDVTATGTIIVKYAPIGLTKPFTGVSKAVYMFPSIEYSGYFVRIDDTVGQLAFINGYKTMTDIDTGSDRVPDISQNKSTFMKSNSANTTKTSWNIICFDKGMYLCINPFDPISNPNYRSRFIYYIGDYNKRKSIDHFNFIISCSSSNTYSVGNYSLSSLTINDSSRSNYIAKDLNGIGLPIPFNNAPAGYGPSGIIGNSSYLGNYPNSSDNSLLLSDMIVVDSGVRGKFPGILLPLQIVTGKFVTGQIIDGSGDYLGKKLLIINTGQASTASSDTGSVFFDITGPW